MKTDYTLTLESRIKGEWESKLMCSVTAENLLELMQKFNTIIYQKIWDEFELRVKEELTKLKEENDIPF